MMDQRKVAARKFPLLSYQGWGLSNGVCAGNLGTAGEPESGNRGNLEQSESPSPTRILRSHTVTSVEAGMLAKKNKCTACENCSGTEGTDNNAETADIELDDERTRTKKKQPFVASKKTATLSNGSYSEQILIYISSDDESADECSVVNRCHSAQPRQYAGAKKSKTQQVDSQKMGNKTRHQPVVNQHHRSRSPVRRTGHCHSCTCNRSESPSPTRVAKVRRTANVKTEPSDSEGEGVQDLNTPMNEAVSSEDEDVLNGRKKSKKAGASVGSGRSSPVSDGDSDEEQSNGDSDEEPASGYSYTGRLMFLGLQDLGKEGRRDFCLFCKKLTSSVREHMLEHHLDEEDVRQAYQMEISGIKVKPWKFLTHQGNEECNNKQALRKMSGYVISCRIGQDRKYLHQMSKCQLCQGWFANGSLASHKKCCPGISWEKFNTKSGRVARLTK